MAVTTMKALLEAGVHFGHRTRRWDPKMKPYIFTERNGVHIIDLQQTMNALNASAALVRDKVSEGGQILFVGTKRQAQETIEFEARRCSMPYVNQRWLGGTLTNWQTIHGRVEHLLNLEARRDRGEFELLTKKEALVLTRQILKLNQRLGGIRDMSRLPELLFVIDIRREITAVQEANKLGIPVIAVVDTNCNPEPIDYVIPANDDAIRAIKLITSVIADAAIEGLDLRKVYQPEMVEGGELAEEDEKYLSAATLARLRELSFEDEEGAEPDGDSDVADVDDDWEDEYEDEEEDEEEEE
ncbi:MAG: 30S ribosomal protein S2 [Anaerolineae bacterium]|nr:30S ribosomal protein S2 [Anaerolineae bacterium]